jgi:hypothetical protein
VYHSIDAFQGLRELASGNVRYIYCVEVILVLGIDVFEEINFCATGSSESQILFVNNARGEFAWRHTLEHGSLC